MMEVQLVVEDRLQDAALRCILHKYKPEVFIRPTAGLRGINYILEKIEDYNRASKFCQYIVLIDLDKRKCAPDLVRRLITFPPTDLFYFRIAVREIEAWLIADRKGFSKFLSIPTNRIPFNSEGIMNPKEKIISWAHQSRKRKIKGLIPTGSYSIGPEYNKILSEFIWHYWDIEEACKHNNSLKRTVDRIKEIKVDNGITPNS